MYFWLVKIKPSAKMILNFLKKNIFFSTRLDRRLNLLFLLLSMPLAPLLTVGIAPVKRAKNLDLQCQHGFEAIQMVFFCHQFLLFVMSRYRVVRKEKVGGIKCSKSCLGFNIPRCLCYEII